MQLARVRALSALALATCFAPIVLAQEAAAPPVVERDFTSFYTAVSELDLARSRARLPATTQVNDRDRRSGATPLTWLAAMVRPPSADATRLAILELLLERGARLDVADHDDGFPLQAAAQSTWAAGVERLLARGASPDVRLGNGWTALHLVCSRSGEEWPERQAARVRIATMLLDAGADPAGTWTAANGQTVSVVQQCTTYEMPDVIAVVQARIAARAGASTSPTSTSEVPVDRSAPRGGGRRGRRAR